MWEVLNHEISEDSERVLPHVVLTTLEGAIGLVGMIVI